jgi:Na+-driven multidrug efflux pump
MLVRIFRVGSAASAERMLSTVMAAAQNITVAAESISWTLGFGFSMATAALTGQRLGANRPDEAEAVSREAAQMSMILLGAVGLLFIAWPGPYLAVFTNDPSVLELGTTALRIAAGLAAGVDWVVRSGTIYSRFQSRAWKAVKV